MSAYSDLLLSTGPVAYWRLGEAAGTAAADASGNGHDGTYNNGPTLGQPGLIVDPDTAVRFNGSTHYVDVPQDPALQIAGALTVQAWIRQDAAKQARIVYQGSSTGSDRLYELFVEADGSLVFSHFDGTTNPEARSAAGVIAPGNTYHVVATRDASLFARVYVNGAEVAAEQLSGPVPGIPTEFLIGVFPGGTQWFNGTIDEVAVHNVALTPEQIADLYELGANGPPPPPSAYRDLLLSTNPVAYWRFGEPGGVTANDSSGNGHDGTYNNGPTLGEPGLIVDTDTAVLLDGVNDHVAVPQHADLKLSGAVTVQAWVRPTTLTAPADIVRQGIAVDIQYGLIVDQSGIVDFAWYDGAFRDVVSPAGVVTVGSTHHVVATRDASLFIRIYVDGVQVASGQGTAPTVDPVAMQISGAGDLRMFNGLIDEVAVHSYALTPEQVAELYELGLNGPPPPPPPPPSGGGVTRPARRYHRMGRGISR